MKKLVFLCIFGIVFLLSSCVSWSGSDSKKDASTVFNTRGRLVTKTPTDFDKKFGYEVLVYHSSPNDSTRIVDEKVFVSKNTWERLPVPNDTTIVYLEYVEKIEYGYNTNGPSLLWDIRFNMCIGYTVEIKK